MITYEAEGVKFPNISKRETSNWIRRVAATYGKKIGDVAYLFVNDDKILETNNEFLGNDYYTDIITFDYCEGNTLSGDLFISIDTVRENAVEYGVEFEDELHRVIVHGLLHLIGYDDQTPEEQKVIHAKEDYYLSIRKSL